MPTKFSLETMSAAFKLMRDIVGVKEGESVVITADTGSDWSVVEAVAKASTLLGAKPMVVWYPMPLGVGKAADPYLPQKPLEAAVSSADVWIEFNMGWLLYSTVWDNVMAEGSVRYLCLVGMGVDMLVRTVERVDVDLVLEFQDKLVEVTKSTRKMRLTSPVGMELEFENDPARPIFTEGRVMGPGDYMLMGQVDWAPIEESINGVLVFDGSVYPPEDVGLLRAPIFLEVEKGRVVSVKGGSEAKRFERWLKSFDDPGMFNIAHISYGCNPGAKLTGNILEDERVWGAVEWGIGNQADSFKGLAGPAKSHTDGICLNPTLIADGEYLIKDGSYVHPLLADMEKRIIGSSG